MKVTYGSMPTSLPEGMFKAVRFPILARLDYTTGDHRRLSAEGASSRATPLSISAQFTKSFGHDGATLTGALYEVTIDTDENLASGRGFLLDDDFGRRHAMAIATGAMVGNSISLAEVSARYVESLDNAEDWFVEFTKFAIADTSGVMTPAFADASIEIDDDIKASLGEDPMEELVANFTDWSFVVPEPTDDVAELLASATGDVACHADFFRPEAPEPVKIVVTADRKVFGHVCLWDTFHASMAGNIRPPRPQDGYKSFNKPGVLTEKGIVPTGPIFAYGGHKKGADLDQAYGGIENAWCDVRIIEGQFGPWVSGVVRPGVSDETVYAARASRISGHWKGGALKAIVSVNAEAYEVEGPDADVLDIAAGYAWTLADDGEVLELVASFPGATDAQELTVSDEERPEQPVEDSVELADDGVDTGPEDDLLLALLLED